MQEQLDQFEESMDQIAEGTWAVPDNDISVGHLQELMADVLPAGIDGTDATGALYDILGDDELFDRIYDASRGSPEMDVRPIIYDWLKSNMPSVFQKVQVSMEQGGTGEEQQEEPEAPPAPEPEQQEPSAPDEQAPDEQQQQAQQKPQPQESAYRSGNSITELAEIRRLAGLH
jgi:hypothetical protein